MTAKLTSLFDPNLSLVYSAEGIELVDAAKRRDAPSIYILLTDTKTQFSKVSKLITGDPYNHVSLMLTDSFDDPIYTYALNNGISSLKGGFMVEDRSNLYGSFYSLYELKVTDAAYRQIKERVEYLAANPNQTRYNHLGLFNAIFRKNIFSSEDGKISICSEFVVEVLRFGGIELLKGKLGSTIRPYDLVRSKLLKFVRRGKIN
jgi:hypothetical protein